MKFLAAPALATSAAASHVTDPCLVIAAERDRLRAIHTALENRVRDIAKANPLPMWGQGWPRVDRSLAVFKGTRFEDGEQIARHEIEMVLRPENREALFKWWDETKAEMDRRGIVTGYCLANDELDAMSETLVDKECKLSDTQVTTIAGALERLKTALAVICTDEESSYDRMALGAFADLRRLTASLS